VASPKQIDIQQNVPLAPLTTLRVGGPARFFVKAVTENEVAGAFEYAGSNGLEVFVLGGGSNVLVSDRGFDGLVIQVAPRGLTYHQVQNSAPESASRSTPPGPDVLITAAAGEDWDEFVASCVARNLAGIECLSGIPGFVGGTPVQNVGAYGQEVSETITSVRCFDLRSNEIIELRNEDCGFTYRTSIFNTTERGRYVVLAVTFRLVDGGAPKIAYKDLRELFGDRPPSLGETREAVLDIRRAKSMVIDPADPNSRSAGSFFKNPIVAIEKLEEIKANSGPGPVPSFAFGKDEVKIPAAWLIERSGFRKGYRLGNAGISTNHSLALVNLGQATAADIVALKDKIQDGVAEKFGIILQPEPVFVGF
jgi:UDP-N-acetylmuramate dehydrogenase